MEVWLEFARGPLFRFAFALCVLGLARDVFLAFWSIGRAYSRAADKHIPWPLVRQRTIRWLFPFRLSTRNRLYYSICSIVFHIGLILVPVFLFAHIQLWHAAIGLRWPALPRIVADILTITTVTAAVLLFVARMGNRDSRIISSLQDQIWPALLAVPFATGFLCAHPAWSPAGYQATMLVHVLSSELILVLMPFTKLAHCILAPLSQLVSDIGWRFPASSGRDVEITLGKQGQPI